MKYHKLVLVLIEIACLMAVQNTAEEIETLLTLAPTGVRATLVPTGGRGG